MEDTLDIIQKSRIHGQSMHIQGLEHAIHMFETFGEEALVTLKKRLEDEKKELEEMRGKSE